MYLRLAVIAAAITFALACEKGNAPATNANIAAPSADELASLQKAAAQERPRAEMPALPANHPPLNAPAQPAPRIEDVLPAGHPPVGDSPPALKYEAPAGWDEQTPTSMMRKAQFVLPRADGDAHDAEMIVFYFGAGQGGAVMANIDRWRGMFTDAEGNALPADAGAVEKFQAGELPVTVLDVSGRYAPSAMPGVPDQGPQDNWRMIAAVVETPNGPWFFKTTGPEATLERLKSNRSAFGAC